MKKQMEERLKFFELIEKRIENAKKNHEAGWLDRNEYVSVRAELMKIREEIYFMEDAE